MSRLRVTAKKMDNAYFLDNAMHICLGIHDKDGNTVSGWNNDAIHC